NQGMLVTLQMKVQGEALTFFQTLTDEEQTDCELVREKFLCFYGKDEFVDAYKVQFSERWKSSSESVAAYAKQLQLLYKSAYPNRTDEETLVDKFIDGLPEAMREHLRRSRRKTFKQ